MSGRPTASLEVGAHRCLARPIASGLMRARWLGRKAMRRMVSMVLALVLSATIAACSGMSGSGMSDQSKSDDSMSQRSGHSGGGY
jgi:hypothetical protein